MSGKKCGWETLGKWFISTVFSIKLRFDGCGFKVILAGYIAFCNTHPAGCGQFISDTGKEDFHLKEGRRPSLRCCVGSHHPSSTGEPLDSILRQSGDRSVRSQLKEVEILS